MKISIIIATFNAAKSLAECLDSCLEQTWQDKEIIVVDGGSTDETVAIIRKYQRHLAFWQSEPDKGIYDAWNKALGHVSGTWVLFRGADDTFWNSAALEAVASSLATAQPDELLCYGSVVVTGDDGLIRSIWGSPWKDARRRFFREMSIPHPGAFHHIDLFRRFGTFDDSYRVAGDYDFLLRAMRHPEVKARFLPALVTRMRDGGASENHMFLSNLEAILARRRNNIPGLPLFLWYRLLTNLRSVATRKALHLLLGGSAAKAVYRRRRRRVSERLQARLTVQFPVTGTGRDSSF